MHQTFYIDIDEEITSIVDRLRKSKSREVVIVVPKRAILIQSIVNLKLLKKEADDLKKEIIIVTQDKFGKMIIEKAGIVVEQRLDDVEGQEVQELEIDDKKIKIGSDAGAAESADNQQRRKRLDKIGSDGYYQAENLDAILGREAVITEQDNEPARKGNESGERILNKELVIDMGDDLRHQQSSFKKNIAKRGTFAPMDMIRNVEMSEDGLTQEDEEITKPTEILIKKSRQSFRQEELSEFEEEVEDDAPKMQRAGSFFEHQKSINANEYKNINIGGGTWKYFVTFGIFAAVVIFGAVGYLYLPKATVTIFTKNKIQSVDTQIDGNKDASAVDLEKEIVPVKIVSVTDEISKTYKSTGKKAVSNQKARGTITIYNEFSSSPQPLVATTRFASSDNKIFRLAVGVTVPGTEKVGTETKAGAIEAEVVADEAGEAYNIEAGTFTIPGFQSSGSDKYAKIYAKSFKSMSGGGQGSQEVGVVTDTDIESAKTKVAQELKPQIMQKLKMAVEDGYLLLDDAVNIDASSYTVSKSVGDASDEFAITVKSSASAIVFKKIDVENVVINLLAKRGDANMEVARESVRIEFGKSDTNFKDGTMVIRVHGVGDIAPVVDLESLKTGILGKQEGELKAYLNTYPDIERIEVIYWPTFINGKIPAYESRVDMSLNSSD
ncbi:MAG: hypothetical protein Q7T51_03155 [Candidatus Moranbacteria bacterium]|nr:hypothetical protein [Candidatus Moranbacteria bacterium]